MIERTKRGYEDVRYAAGLKRPLLALLDLQDMR